MIEILIAFVLFFRQSLKLLGSDYDTSAFFAGNLDLLYAAGFLGLLYIAKSKPFLRAMIVLIAIVSIQLFAITDLNQGNVLIYAAKLLLCISLLFFVRLKFSKLNLSKIAVTFSALVASGVAVATTIGLHPSLWTIDDEVNKFDASRLMLTYIEPSELGFSIVVIVLLLIHLLFKTRSKRIRVLYAASILVNLYALYLAKPFGAIAIGVVAMVCMVIFQLIYVNPTLRKQCAAIFLICLGIVTLLGAFAENSAFRMSGDSIVQRGLSAVDGEDDSINYRVGLSLEVTTDSLNKSPILGQGFGTLGSEQFIDQYYDIGLRTSLANSYLAFIAEVGIVGLLIVVYLIFKLYEAAFRTKSYFVFGLTTFVVLYQFTGGYFSNPLVWALYGAILAMGDTAVKQKKQNQRVISK